MIQHLIAKIEELEAELKTAQAIEAAKARDDFAAIKIEYDYQVTWPHPAMFRIERKVSDKTQDAIDAWREAWPDAKSKELFVGGMTYMLLEGGYIYGRGGAVVVNFGEGHSFDPIAVDAEIIADLRAGIVPDSIKRP